MLSLVINAASADETVSEKVSAAGNTAGRTVKKGAHRVQEATCTKGQVGCAGEKVKNRAVEAKDSVVDGATEVKNKVD